MIPCPARGVLARTAFYVPCGARGARRSLVDNFRPASAASPGGSAPGVEFPLFRSPRFPAHLADGAAFGGFSFSTSRTEARLLSLAPAPHAPLARHAAAALWIAPAISSSLFPGFGVSGALGGAGPFEAGVAQGTPGCGGIPPAFRTNPPLLARFDPTPVAFAIELASHIRVTVGHSVSLPGVDGIRTAGAPARRLARRSPPQGDFIPG